MKSKQRGRISGRESVRKRKTIRRYHQVTLYVTPDEHSKLHDMANLMGLSMSRIMALLINRCHPVVRDGFQVAVLLGENYRTPDAVVEYVLAHDVESGGII